MNLQVIASPTGEIVWVSGPLPGAVHDTKAAWIWGVLRELEAAGLVTLADKGYQGAAHARTPYNLRSAGSDWFRDTVGSEPAGQGSGGW
jgi:hypothetical protein